jgi:hypothetical protein
MCCFIELGLQISRKVYLLHTISLLESTENDNDVVMCSIITTFGSSLPPVVCRRDQALFRDRPFHLKGGGLWFFASFRKKISDNTYKS